MKVLPEIDRLENGTKVMLRMDLDVPIEDGMVTDNSRLTKSVETICEILKRECKLIILGHLGRPAFANGYGDASLAEISKYSLKPVYAELMALVDEAMGTTISSVFIENVEEQDKVEAAIDSSSVVFFENIRFFAGEREKSTEFTKYLASLADVYVQESFAVAHHPSPSMNVGSILPCYFGKSFVKEYSALEQVVENPKKPIVVILGGTKIDKLDHIETLENVADKILLVGILPREVNLAKINEKVVLGSLREDGLDIDNTTIEKFSEILSLAGTIIWAGSAGKWEDEASAMGTKRLLEVVANSGAFTVIAGGDTTAACRKFGYENKMGLISSGGGVMMEFLAKGKLPVVEEALIV